MSIFNPKDDEAALEKLLESGKAKLVEAGAKIVKLAGDEIDGFQIDVTVKFSRKTS